MPWMLGIVASAALCLGGCGPTHREPGDSTPPPSTGAPEEPPVIDGAWTDPIEGFELTSLAATADRVLVAGYAGEVAEVRAARVDAAPLRLATLRVVPAPPVEVHPWLAVDLTARGGALAVNRGEYQGGSWGVVVYPDLGATAYETIDSPTDADIGFGEPMVLRGDELFTVESSETLWHYRRQGGRWAGARVALPSGETEVVAALALAPDGGTFIAVTQRDGEWFADVFTRAPAGAFVAMRSVRLPAEATGAAFVRDSVVVGFLRPASDGAGLWLLDPRGARPPRPVTVPLETNDTAVHALDVSGDLAVVTQLRGVVVIDLRARAPVCRLRVPAPSDGRLPSPRAVMVGRRVVVLARGRLGLFDLAGCLPPER